ncbi:MAG: arylesterase [Pseudomonadota bacterium]
MSAIISRLSVSLVCLASLAACGQDAVAPASAEPDPLTAGNVQLEVTATPPTIVMLGDSLTAGYGLPNREALPAELERQLKAAGTVAKLVNAGVSGDTSANGLARYDWSVGASDADILIVALGGNDFLQGVSPDTVRENLAEILTRAQQDGLRVVLAGLDPREADASSSVNTVYAAIYTELAETFEVPLYADLLDGVWNDPSLLLPDGLHPNAAGVDLVAEQLADFLLTRNIIVSE